MKNFPGPMYDNSGGGFTNGSDAYSPFGSLVLGNDALYGTTIRGGLRVSVGSGGVFCINTNGSGYAVLKGFSPGATMLTTT